MEIKQLRAFLAVASAHSFLGAAERLYITRQAVSKTVTQLEDELGVKLFVRGQTGTELTPAGAYFYPQVRALVADFASHLLCPELAQSCPLKSIIDQSQLQYSPE